MNVFTLALGVGLTVLALAGLALAFTPSSQERGDQ